MTPLRWKIAAGYAVFIIITIILWKDLLSGWSLLLSFLAPVITFFTALVALKFSVVLASLGSFLLVFLTSAVSTLIAVSKLGVIKGLFLPWLLSGLQWLHGKSEFLQRWVAKIYAHAKTMAEGLFNWWNSKNLVDKFLLMGFVGPLIAVVAFVVLLKRFVYLFISRKAAEQIVQRLTKKMVSNFHKIPLVGALPNIAKVRAQDIRKKRDLKLAQVTENSESPQ